MAVEWPGQRPAAGRRRLVVRRNALVPQLRCLGATPRLVALAAPGPLPPARTGWAEHAAVANQRAAPTQAPRRVR
eukprot:scaffold235541_cov39-Tisochrysis_lutea.AAC.1